MGFDGGVLGLAFEKIFPQQDQKPQNSLAPCLSSSVLLVSPQACKEGHPYYTNCS